MTEKTKNEMLNQIFSVMAPGQALRNAVDRIKEASLGALIVLSEPEELEDLMEGGFVLYTDFSPQKLYELAKMDGAVIVSKNIKKIYGANIQLQPNHNLETDESGTRHRTAHRIAMQTGKMVITISERRNKITVFINDFKYILDSIPDLLIKSSQAIMSLEKYSSIINKFLNNLNYLEYEKMVSLDDLIMGIRFYSLLFNMQSKVKQYILELGIEGKTLQLQHDEIMLGHKTNLINLIKDYCNLDSEKPEKIFEKILKIEDINNDGKIIEILGYELKNINYDDIFIAKGYRFLDNINGLNKKDVESIIERFSDINSIFEASKEEMQTIKGISKMKSFKVIRGREKYKNVLELESL